MLENQGILPSDDLILFDWLTFTIKTDDLAFVMDLIGMKDVPWEQIDRYMNGYPHRKYFYGVSLMYGADESMGICVNMSGQGCRAYESYGANQWEHLIRTIFGSEHINITRLDMAFDDHSGLIDLHRLRCDTDSQNYVSKSKKWTIEYGSDGTTIYHGSKKSDMLIRIYDKAAERGYDEDTHWIRIELQMRDKIANGFCAGLIVNDVGMQYRGVLCNYLRYVEPSEGDSNKSRWPLADYWEKLLEGVQAIRCWSAPGVDYNMSHLESFIFRQAGNAIDTYLKIFGYIRFQDQLRKRNVQLSPKYQRLLAEYGFSEEGG